MQAKTRSLLREIALDVLALGAKPSKGIHLLNGHILGKEENLDASFFDDQLKTISRKSTIVPFAEAVELLNSKKTVNHSLVAFSYDDGFAECYSHIAPVLEKFNGYAAFFVCPNFIDGDEKYVSTFLKDNVHQPLYKAPMNWTQVRELHNKGHVIGAHTMDHIRVSELIGNDELHYQIGACKGIIEKYIKANCNNFAFTYGHLGRDFSLRDIEIAENYYSNIFSAFEWNKYFCCDDRVMNRRQVEPYWKASHANYFISKKIKY